MNDTRAQDREEILNHIHGIFQAYLRKDRETIRRLHTHDWIGFQGPSTGIERGLDDYMRNAEASLQNLHGTGFEILDHEIRFHGEVAIVYYVARYDYRDGEGEAHSAPLRSVDIYRRDAEGWNQAGSHITVVPSGGVWSAEAK